MKFISPLLFLFISLNLYAQPHKPLFNPAQIKEAFQNNEVAKLTEVRDRLQDYLVSPDADLKESAIEASAYIGISDKAGVEMLSSAFETEKSDRVRASIVKAVAPFTEQNEMASALVVSAISGAYESDDRVAVQVVTIKKIPQATEPLLLLLRDKDSNVRLSALTALTKNYEIPASYADLLQEIKQQADDEIKAAMPLFAQYTPEQRKSYVDQLPANLLSQMIDRVKYLEEIPPSAPKNISQKPPELLEDANAIKKEFSDVEADRTIKSPTQPATDSSVATIASKPWSLTIWIIVLLSCILGLFIGRVSKK